MKRRNFIMNAGILGAGYALSPSFSYALPADFPVVRVAKGLRNFSSVAVENAIGKFSKSVKNKELVWLFENCFPNTLDTTVTYNTANGKPDTYVITGDIDAMWLRDSSAQVWPYLQFVKQDKKIKDLIHGVINRQTMCVLKDPYANAFYDDPNKAGEWASDITDMKTGVHERKWEIDSLCYTIRLAYHYWKATGDVSSFGGEWVNAIKLILQTFKEQQRKENNGPYSFQRETAKATDTLAMSGFGYPVKPVGLICSSFRPSDDATVLSFLIPSNFFAVVSLQQASEMVKQIVKDNDLANQLMDLSNEVKLALAKYAIVKHPKYGDVYAFEADGFGNTLMMDDSNVPSLLSLPYLGAISNSDPIYINTRKMILSDSNPFYFSGSAAKGIGGPHAGQDMIWPMSLIIQALTSTQPSEIKECIATLQRTHANTGFMHESFHKDDPKNFTRPWFAWANTLFGELLWKTYQEHPELLS